MEKFVTSKRQREAASIRETRVERGRAKPEKVVELAELTTRARKGLGKSQFAIPEKRAYPIHDAAHARNALARVSQFGTPAEKARVRAAVKRKYPNMMSGPMKGGK